MYAVRLVLLCLVLLPGSALAQRGVFLTVDDFLAQHFDATPSSVTLWLSAEQKLAAQAIVQRNPGLRTRYFRLNNRTAWVLEDIGKELPITVGVIVEQGRILSLQVLEYREVRGGEVRYPNFTGQFDGAGLTSAGHQLDRSIDGVSGATLSVRALRNIARLALYFHQQVVAPPAAQAH